MRFHPRHIFNMMAAATAAVIMASCSHDKIEAGARISLSANLQSQTRGVIASADAIKFDGAAFGVYGYKSFNSLDQLIFNNVKVSYSESSTDWSYTPKKYWDRNAYYHYLAYWPYGLNVSNNNTDHILTISDIPNWQQADSDAIDVMLAYSQMRAVDYLNENGGEVRFTFNHMLAQIVIKAWYFGNKNKKPYITGLSVGSAAKPVAEEGGTTVIRQKYSDIFDPVYSGPTSSGDATLLTSASGDAVEQYFDTEDEGAASTLRTTMCTWMVIPFGSDATAGVPLAISYKLGENGTARNFTANDVPLGKLQAGNTYVATLKFDTEGDVVNLEGIIVRKWTTGEDLNKEVYNW